MSHMEPKGKDQGDFDEMASGGDASSNVDDAANEVKGMTTAPDPIERDCMNRPIILDGCVRGTPGAKRLAMDLLYPEEQAPMKDQAELLLEPGDWKKNDMFFEYRLKEGEMLKGKGNECFKAKDYSQAAVWYRKGLYYTVFDESQFNFELQDEHRIAVVKVAVPLHLNYSLCILKDEYRPLRRPLPSLEERFNEAIENCSAVLAHFKEKQDGLQGGDKVKALYRRGLAKIGKGDLDRAKEDLTEALKLEPQNNEIRQQLGVVKEKERADKERQKAVWSGKLAHSEGILEDDESAAGSGAGEKKAADDKVVGEEVNAVQEQEAKAAAIKRELQKQLDALEGRSEGNQTTGEGWGSWLKKTLLG